MRTNPAFAELAYRKAIVDDILRNLRENYTSAYGGEPEKAITSEDVFREDCDVPESAVVSFLEDLEQESADIRVEMLKFEFVERTGNGTRIGRKKTKARSKSKGRAKQASKA